MFGRSAPRPRTVRVATRSRLASSRGSCSPSRPAISTDRIAASWLAAAAPGPGGGGRLARGPLLGRHDHGRVAGLGGRLGLVQQPRVHLVGADHRLGRAQLHHAAVVQPQRHVAQLADVVGAVRAEQNGAAVVAKALDALDALLLEMLVAHRQRLVDDQQVGLQRRHQRKRQPHRHARRIGLHRPVDRLADLGERQHLGLQHGHLLVRDADQAAAEVQVLPAREVGVKTRPQLQDGRHAPAAPDLARGRLQGAADQLQQRALARPVVAHHAQALAARQLQRHVLQRPVAAVQRAPGQERLQARARRVVHAVLLAHPGEAQGQRRQVRGRRAHSQSTSWSRLRASASDNSAASTPIQASSASHTASGGQAPCSRADW